jgi:dephospho-CoA kinase
MSSLPGPVGILVLGVTGGIASGKSTVTEMMREFGAPVVDFYIHSREVVEPGKPAWQDIVGYFGTRVLQENGALDRKKLSRIVFENPGKREKLESITHPRIVDLFVERLREIERSNPDAIVLAVIPLLFEARLHDLVHKILVVYIPREMQRKRLMKRDKISREQAEHILKAQLSIDGKMENADFVIRNEKGLEETRKQVIHLWQILEKEQERRKENG